MVFFNSKKAETTLYDENFTGSFLSFGKKPKPSVWERVKSFVGKTEHNQKPKKSPSQTSNASPTEELTKEDLTLSVKLTDRMAKTWKKVMNNLREEDGQKGSIEK